MGFNDSKALDEKQREALFRRMKATPGLGWCVPENHCRASGCQWHSYACVCRIIHSIPASELSAKMLRREPVSLNHISHDAGT